MREERLELIRKCDTINDLFEMWMKEQKNESDVDWEITKGQTKNIEKGTFCIDGIINTDRFQKQNKKVLFITNEANADGYTGNEQTEFMILSNIIKVDMIAGGVKCEKEYAHYI